MVDAARGIALGHSIDSETVTESEDVLGAMATTLSLPLVVTNDLACIFRDKLALGECGGSEATEAIRRAIDA
eukprot:COSAG01_NODE_26463_length_713_cov_1.293160_1_plen_71_part_10